MKQIFPKEIIENSAEVHQFRHSSRSKLIYLLVLIVIVVGFVALPFIKVSLNTTARGTIKPSKERTVLIVINSGQILYSNLLNNKNVKKGDTLLIIDNNGIDNNLQLLNYQLEETKLFVKDLNLLLKVNSIKHKQLQSLKFQRVFMQYSQKLSELNIRLKKTKKDYDRNKTLYDKGVIAMSDFENKKLEYDLVRGDVYQFKRQQQNIWQTDLTQYDNAIRELHNRKDGFLENKEQYMITAPTNGVLLNINHQEAGSFISAGTTIGEISPDANLLVEVYVSPLNIGYLKNNNKISFQVDAYNYNQWGLATGEILEIGGDIELLDNQPIFKVRCKMDQTYLSLKNGFEGKLKKGMTLNANFELTERSLYDLLYDKMDDWLNPSRNSLNQF
ncbi:MAG: secretion protein HlyD [Flavobacteriaceae bacterium]|nr:MAG: secretion protein HlyD [Flavobacteriaceae bacterium]